MRSQRKRGNRPRGRSPPDILYYSYPRCPEPRRARKKKNRVCSAPPSKPGHDCPPRNVQLRQEYSTRIREVKVSRVKPAAGASGKGAPALWYAAAMADQPERRPGEYGLGVLGGYGYWRAAPVASNWPRSPVPVPALASMTVILIPPRFPVAGCRFPPFWLSPYRSPVPVPAVGPWLLQAVAFVPPCLRPYFPRRRRPVKCFTA